MEIGVPKNFNDLKRIFECVCPDLMLVQRTICLVNKACKVLLNILSIWEFFVSNSIVLSGVLLDAWRPEVLVLKLFFTEVGIFLQGSLGV